MPRGKLLEKVTCSIYFWPTLTFSIKDMIWWAHLHWAEQHNTPGVIIISINKNIQFWLKNRTRLSLPNSQMYWVSIYFKVKLFSTLGFTPFLEAKPKCFLYPCHSYRASPHPHRNTDIIGTVMSIGRMSFHFALAVWPLFPCGKLEIIPFPQGVLGFWWTCIEDIYRSISSNLIAKVLRFSL